MGYYEQMEIDVTLESERSLKDNVAKVIQFAYDQRNMEAENSGRPIPPVRNKHEGYGIAAEMYSKIELKNKDVKNGMNAFLSLLQVQGEDAVQSCAKLYDGALNLAIEAINMAAEMNRVLNDLYYGADRRTPLEKLADEQEGTEDGVEGDADGFEEAEPVESSEEETEGEDEAQDGAEEETGNECE